MKNVFQGEVIPHWGGLLRSMSGEGCKGHGIWLCVRWGRASPDVPWAAEQGTGPWDEPGCWALLLAGVHATSRQREALAGPCLRECGGEGTADTPR